MTQDTNLKIPQGAFMKAANNPGILSAVIALDPKHDSRLPEGRSSEAWSLVAFQEIFAKTLGVMNLSEDCMGEKNGRPAVLVPFSNGGMELRLKGLLEKEGRFWRLTDAGYQTLKTGVIPKKNKGGSPAAPKAPKTPATKAAPAKAEPQKTEVETEATNDEFLASDPVFAVAGAAPLATPPAKAPTPIPVETPKVVKPPPPPPKPETVEDQAARLIDGTPAPSSGKQKARKLHVLPDPTPDAPEWTKDGYLRALVAANTPCFGAFSPKVKTCELCPLMLYCVSAQASALTVLVGALNDKAAREPKITPGEFTSTHGVVAAAMTHGRPRTDAGQTAAKLMVASFDGVCARSGETITKGDKVYYVPGEGLVSEKAYNA